MSVDFRTVTVIFRNVDESTDSVAMAVFSNKDPFKEAFFTETKISLSLFD